MKKIISLTLSALMLFGLCACGGSGEKKPQTQEPETPVIIQVGFGRDKITPTVPVPLGGYGNVENRMSETTSDHLYATCTAFKEGEQTLLLFSLDAIRSAQKWTDEARKRINEATGVPQQNIMIMSTHTHSAPELNSNMPCITETYWETYMNGVVNAAKAAIEDLAVATMYGTSVKVDKLNFVRHYKMEDGSYAGSNFGDWKLKPVDYAAEKDDEMLLVKIEREGDKKPILLMNWAAHPCFTGGATVKVVSADYIATCRSKIERSQDMHFMFILGAAGNQNGFSNLPADKGTLSNKEYGETLAKKAIAALDSMTPIASGKVEIEHLEVEYAVNREGADAEKQRQAQEVIDLWDRSGDREVANALAKTYGISSVYEASAILGRPERPETNTIIVDATRIGGLSFVHTPWEMFAAEGKYIKENSPFGMTFVATQANHAWGYFPSSPAYEFNGSGCYESFGAMFVKGCAEDMAQKLVGMLNTLHN